MPLQESKLRLHYGRPDPTVSYQTTFCGMWLEEVIYWATPEVAEHMTFTTVCARCARSLARRERDFIAEVGRG